MSTDYNQLCDELKIKFFNENKKLIEEFYGDQDYYWEVIEDAELTDPQGIDGAKPYLVDNFFEHIEEMKPLTAKELEEQDIQDEVNKLHQEEVMKKVKALQANNPAYSNEPCSPMFWDPKEFTK